MFREENYIVRGGAHAPRCYIHFGYDVGKTRLLVGGLLAFQEDLSVEERASLSDKICALLRDPTVDPNARVSAPSWFFHGGPRPEPMPLLGVAVVTAPPAVVDAMMTNPRTDKNVNIVGVEGIVFPIGLLGAYAGLRDESGRPDETAAVLNRMASDPQASLNLIDFHYESLDSPFGNSPYRVVLDDLLRQRCECLAEPLRREIGAVLARLPADIATRFPYRYGEDKNPSGVARFALSELSGPLAVCAKQLCSTEPFGPQSVTGVKLDTARLLSGARTAQKFWGAAWVAQDRLERVFEPFLRPNKTVPDGSRKELPPDAATAYAGGMRLIKEAFARSYGNVAGLTM